MDLQEQDVSIGGVSIHELKEKYGTPLYIYDVERIRENIREVYTSFLAKYPGTTCAYAGKAFLCGAMVDLLMQEGLHLDVVSGGELYLAMTKGFPPEWLEFNGNNKSIEELVFAVKYGVGKIIVDGEDELETLSMIAHELGKKVSVLFRVSPGVDAHTHEKIRTAQIDSKFGFQLPGLEEQIRKVEDHDYLYFQGFHCHIGSQLFEVSPFLEAIDKMMPVLTRTRSLLGRPIEELNLGGGFGICYTDEQRLPLSEFVDPIMAKLDHLFGKERPVVGLEPGRSIVGDAGSTLYTVGNVKYIRGVRNYAALDGGMSDNIRPTLYGAKYRAIHGEKPLAKGEDVYTLVGKLCESGDKIIEDILLPKLSGGELLLVPSTGAYGYAMASNYNGMTFPSIVFVEKGKAREVVRRQTSAELFQRDLFL